MASRPSLPAAGMLRRLQAFASNGAGLSAVAGPVNYFTLLPGDINGDGLVDVADYDIWAANVGATCHYQQGGAPFPNS
jgi:hypothetical protein